MQQSRLAVASVVLPFVLMSCGNSPEVPAPPSREAALSAAITATAANNDASTVTYRVSYTANHQYFRVYIDTDRSADSGFQYGGVGAEFLLENNSLYRYAGSGSDWAWTSAGAVAFSNASGTATWTVSRSALGETDPCASAANLVFDIDDGTAPVMQQVLTSATTCPTATAISSTSVTASATGGSMATPTAAGATTSNPGTGTGSSTSMGTTNAAGHIQVVFVIALENEAETGVYGSASAPYINKTLIPQYAHGTAFTDPLPDSIPSEPHYLWMEAGTNAFSDATFTTDAEPSASNSTASTAHLTTQMMTARPAVSWLSFQEGLDASSTGACPVSSSGFYAAKHDPFVFFQDISGETPSATSSLCVAHHRAYTTSSFAQALTQGTVAQYNFITPNLCNDMHGATGCPNSNVIAAGDSWLSTNLPPIIQYANAHNGVIFLVWDEPEGGSPLIPFLAIGPHVKAGYTSTATVTHSALVKTVEKMFGLPLLPTVASANDFADVFQAGYP